jgi:hypothetical protein
LVFHDLLIFLRKLAMLDAGLVLQEAEALLDNHYTAWQRTPGRVRVYEKPAHAQIARQDDLALTRVNGAGQQPAAQEPHSATPNPSAPAKSTAVGEVLTNLCLFLFLTVLNQRLTRRQSR